MACTITLSAYEPGCNTIGGVEAVYIIDKDAREGTDITVTVTNGAGTIAGTPASGTAYLWKQLQNGFNFTQPITATANEGTNTIVQTLEGQLRGYTAANIYLINQLRKTRTEAVVKLRSGVYLYAGLDDIGLQVTGGDNGQSGQGANDFQGVNLTLTCETFDEAPTITFSEFDAAFTITEPA